MVGVPCLYVSVGGMIPGLPLRLLTIQVIELAPGAAAMFNHSVMT
jgi:hypothetical protein